MKKQLLSDLFKKLKNLDGALYRKYKSLQGSYASKEWTLTIQKTQSDSSAPPSHFTITVPNLYADFPLDLILNPESKIPLADFMLRRFEQLSRKISDHKGSGKSGLFYSDPMGPEMLMRSAFTFTPQNIDFHFRYGLPGTGNRIEAKHFEKALNESFPKIVSELLNWASYNQSEVIKHINCYKDHEFLRNQLPKQKIVAFIPDGAILPRESSQSFYPLPQAIPFLSPSSLKITLQLPHYGKITGLGIPCGITLITGGGFHGKSTLLNAIKMGIYNHIPGDGREFLVSLKDTFKINSEDGRIASGIDISPYIQNLPFKRSSSDFSSLQCSGSTSQAATTIESVRMQSKCLLFDEDTSATNFLICDHAMNEIIGKKDKTILPFLESAKDLFDSTDVSTIMVAGSFSPGINIATLILKISDYKIEDITDKAKDTVNKYPESIIEPKKFKKASIHSKRIIDSSCFRIQKRKKPFKTQVTTKKQIQVENFKLNFYDNEQIIDICQTKTLLALLLKFEELIFNRRKNFESAIFELFEKELMQNLTTLSENRTGFGSVRPIDLAHMLNRFKFLKIK